MSNEASPMGEAVLLKAACEKFKESFRSLPSAAACSPGRVNLIGDHVDYCEGFVLPMALPFLTVVVGSYNSTPECRVISILANGEKVETSFLAPTSSAPLKRGQPAWANYVKGVVANFPGEVKGFDAVIISDLPMGSGLSSSASIEVAVFTFLEKLTGKLVEPIKKALLCQKAEHDFPGVPCGIMDQYVVSMAKKGHALLIDCKSLEAKHIPLITNDTVILVVNSNVKHELTGSEYPQRRAQCQEAAQKLGVTSLRSADCDSIKELEKQGCEDLVLKRAKHVVEEIKRTEEVAGCLIHQDFIKAGKLFTESHESLSKQMEVSCLELDKLESIARGTAGVYGARMTGGGFGGCLVVLVKRENVVELKQRILAQYSGQPTFFVSEPSEGARFLVL